jgi:hypothetical protein
MKWRYLMIFSTRFSNNNKLLKQLCAYLSAQQDKTMSTNDNNAKVCQTLLDDALAACVIGRNGNVSFFYGDEGALTNNVADAAIILEAISNLLANQKMREVK